MERLEGLDEEFQKEETEKVTSIEEAKKKTTISLLGSGRCTAQNET